MSHAAKRTRSQLTLPESILRLPLYRSPLKDARSAARNNTVPDAPATARIHATTIIMRPPSASADAPPDKDKDADANAAPSRKRGSSPPDASDGHDENVAATPNPRERKRAKLSRTPPRPAPPQSSLRTPPPHRAAPARHIDLAALAKRPFPKVGTPARALAREAAHPRSQSQSQAQMHARPDDASRSRSPARAPMTPGRARSVPPPSSPSAVAQERDYDSERARERVRAGVPHVDLAARAATPGRTVSPTRCKVRVASAPPPSALRKALEAAAVDAAADGDGDGMDVDERTPRRAVATVTRDMDAHMDMDVDQSPLTSRVSLLHAPLTPGRTIRRASPSPSPSPSPRNPAASARARSLSTSAPPPTDPATPPPPASSSRPGTSSPLSPLTPLVPTPFVARGTGAGGGKRPISALALGVPESRLPRAGAGAGMTPARPTTPLALEAGEEERDALKTPRAVQGTSVGDGPTSAAPATKAGEGRSAIVAQAPAKDTEKHQSDAAGQETPTEAPKPGSSIRARMKPKPKPRAPAAGLSGARRVTRSASKEQGAEICAGIAAAKVAAAADPAASMSTSTSTAGASTSSKPADAARVSSSKSGAGAGSGRPFAFSFAAPTTSSAARAKSKSRPSSPVKGAPSSTVTATTTAGSSASTSMARPRASTVFGFGTRAASESVFSFSTPAGQTGADREGEREKGSSLSTLSRALEKLARPAPARPNTSLGFSRARELGGGAESDGEVEAGADGKGKGRAGAGCISRDDLALGVKGPGALKRSATVGDVRRFAGSGSGSAAGTSAALTADASSSSSATPASGPGDAPAPRLKINLKSGMVVGATRGVRGKIVAGARGKGIFGPGGAGRGTGTGVMGPRTVQRASKRTPLPMVVGSPVKGGAGADADEAMEAMEAPAAARGGVGRPLFGDGDLSIEAADDATDGRERSSGTGKEKARSADGWKNNASRRASLASHMLSQSLSAVPQTPPTAGAMGPPAVPPAKARAASSNYPASSSSGSGSGSTPTSARGKAAQAAAHVSAAGKRGAGAGASTTTTTPDGTPVRAPGRVAGGVLKDCTIFVDVRTDEGDDAGSLFVEMLEGMGARLLTRVGQTCTHIVYKNGLMSTVTRWRLLKEPRAHVVGIAWVVECVERSAQVDEAPFAVDLEGVNVAGTNKRKRSMLPKHIPVDAAYVAARASPAVLLSDGDQSMDGSSSSMMLDGPSPSSNRGEDSLPPLERARRRQSMVFKP